MSKWIDLKGILKSGGTVVYGSSDDLIDFEGEYRGEVSCYGTDERDRGVLVVFNDGTMVEVKYGKGGTSVWGITRLRSGHLFDRIEQAPLDEDVVPYSDVLIMRQGVTMAWAAADWQRVE